MGGSDAPDCVGSLWLARAASAAWIVGFVYTLDLCCVSVGVIDGRGVEDMIPFTNLPQHITSHRSCEMYLSDFQSRS